MKTPHYFSKSLISLGVSVLVGVMFLGAISSYAFTVVQIEVDGSIDEIIEVNPVSGWQGMPFVSESQASDSDTPTYYSPSEGSGVSPTLSGLNISGAIVNPGDQAVGVDDSFGVRGILSVLSKTNPDDRVAFSPHGIHSLVSGVATFFISTLHDMQISAKKSLFLTAGLGDDVTGNINIWSGDKIRYYGSEQTFYPYNGTLKVTMKGDLDVNGPLSNSTGPLLIEDDLSVMGRIKTTVEISAPKISAGKIIANKIGTTTVRYAGSIVQDLTNNSEQLARCNPGEVLFSCGFEAYDASEGVGDDAGYSLTHPYVLAGRIYMGDANDELNGGECTVGFWNLQSSNPANIKTYAVCFDPAS